MKTLRSVFRIYLLYGRSNGLHGMYAIMLRRSRGHAPLDKQTK